MKYTKEEFDKHDKEMTRSVQELKFLVDSAENQASEVVDGKWYPTPHVWRTIAEKALDLAKQQEWFDRYEAKEV